MSKIRQSHRIERIFGVRGIQGFSVFTPTGQPLTVIELELLPGRGGSGHAPTNDDAYLIVTNVGAPCGMSVVRDIRTVFDDIVPVGRTIAIDLAQPFDVAWSGPLHAIAAYLPRHAIFEGHKGLEQHSIVDNTVLDDDLLGAIMACLRQTAGPSNPQAFELFARQLLAAACSCLARTHSVLMSEPRLRRLALSDEQRQSAIDYILSHLDSAFSMHHVAAVCGLSYRLFTRAFRLSLGASPQDWTNATRVNRAKRLMQDPSLRLSDIALMVGFCDQSHLNRVFFRFCACTPGEWRRNHEQKRTIEQHEPA
ncbi:AraC family transcriptional regulator [Luteibacter sp. OK325]|uniref:helix-turn-helix domain-containing protein n=1 Tax=Luteibacter sp. OK325 TaxID=2135670 RepID=UPI000D36ABE4|nr:AraC family transcriptional regulator [Luteibacter sp. OK325]